MLRQAMEHRRRRDSVPVLVPAASISGLALPLGRLVVSRVFSAVEPAVEVAASTVTVETLDFGRELFLMLCRLHAIHDFRLLGGPPARLIGAPLEPAVEQAEQHRWQTFGVQQAE